MLGVLSGFLSGLLGVGGGVIIVPALISIFHAQGVTSEHLMSLASGTSCAVMSITALRTVVARGDEIRPGVFIFKKMIATVLFGSIAGVLVSQFIHPSIIYYTFALLLVLVSIRLLFFEQTAAGLELKSAPFRTVGLCIGFLASMLGIGGSSFTVPFLLSRGIGLQRATLVSISLIACLAPVACLVYVGVGLHSINFPGCVGYVCWPAVVCVGGLSCISSPWGVYCAKHTRTRVLQRCFALVLILVSTHLALHH